MPIKIKRRLKRVNSVQLVGRLTKDPEVRYTDGGHSIARFNLAVDRRYKRENEANADFISCIAFSKTAQFIEKYFKKGQRIGLNGRIQTGSYTNKDGQTVYTTDVAIESVEFVESKSNSNGYTGETRPNPENADADGFMNIPDNIDDGGLPFN